MDIRYAARNDLQSVYSLICELENEEMPMREFEEIYLKNIYREDIHYLVIEEKGEIVAFGSMHIQSLLHHSSDVAEIQELVVKGDYKGKGIGAKLLDKLKELSLDNECELIEVCCNRIRIDAHEFYEHNGFNKSHYKFTLR